MPINTREKLMETALDLFALRGVHAVSVRDITEAAGCNVASINYHFGDKFGMLEAIFKDYFDSIRQRIEDENLYELPTETRLKVLCSIMQKNLKESPKISRLMFKLLLTNDDPQIVNVVQSIVSQSIKPLCSVMQEASCEMSKKFSKGDIPELFWCFLIVGMNNYWSIMAPAIIDVFDDMETPADLENKAFESVFKALDLMLKNDGDQ